jgi:hypothetical protein
MKALALLFGAGLVFAQANQVTDTTDAYLRGLQLRIDCLSHPSCAAALQAEQARKDNATAEKARLKAEAQARKDKAKADKERQKTEVKLAQLRLKQEQEAAKARAKS